MIKQKLKQFSLTLAALLTFAVPMLTPAAAHAALDSQLCQGVGQVTGTNCDPAQGAYNEADDPVNKLIKTIVKYFSWIVGAASIIMIMYGGFRYITSGGASDKITSAKNTILYALIGLVLVALANVLVSFVLRGTSDLTA